MRTTLSFLSLTLLGCGSDPDPTDQRLEELQAQVAQLTERLDRVESHMPRPPAPPAQPARTRQSSPGGQPGYRASGEGRQRGDQASDSSARASVEVEVSGDAAAVVLQSGKQKRRFKVPAMLPAGRYAVLAAFGEGEMERRNEVMLPREGGAVVLDCQSATQTCAIR